jgi:hypothetical protein
MLSRLNEAKTTKQIEPSSILAVGHALTTAAILLPLRLSPFERSAALTIMMRRQGWEARFVIGVQVLPPEDHAWVELDGQVVNDSQDVRALYRVLVNS